MARTGRSQTVGYRSRNWESGRSFCTRGTDRTPPSRSSPLATPQARRLILVPRRSRHSANLRSELRHMFGRRTRCAHPNRDSFAPLSRVTISATRLERSNRGVPDGYARPFQQAEQQAVSRRCRSLPAARAGAVVCARFALIVDAPNRASASSEGQSCA